MGGTRKAERLLEQAQEAQARLDLHGARLLMQQARDAFERAGDRAGLARVCCELSLLCLDQASGSGAVVHMEAARDLYKELGRPGGQAGCAQHLGMFALMFGRPGTAVAEFREALELYDRLAHGEWRDHYGRLAARCHLQLAQAHEKAGSLEEALAQGRLALARPEALGDPAQAAECLCHLAVVTGRLGDFEESLNLCEEALSRLKGTGEHRVMAKAHGQTGITLTLAGRTVEAVAHSVMSVNLLMRTTFPDLGENLLWLGRQRSALPEAEFRSLVQQHAAPGLADTIIVRVDENLANAARGRTEAV